MESSGGGLDAWFGCCPFPAPFADLLMSRSEDILAFRPKSSSDVKGISQQLSIDTGESAQQVAPMPVPTLLSSCLMSSPTTISHFALLVRELEIEWGS